MTASEWLHTARRINNRRRGHETYLAALRHSYLIDKASIDACDCIATLEGIVRLIEVSSQAIFGRPNRGHRGEHWTTPIYKAAKNRIAVLHRRHNQ